MARARSNAWARLAGDARTKALSSWMPTRNAEALDGPASATTSSATARARRAAVRPCFMSRTTVAAGRGAVARVHDMRRVKFATLVPGPRLEARDRSPRGDQLLVQRRRLAVRADQPRVPEQLARLARVVVE